MASKVVIVESPTKARTLKKLLGRDFNVLASVGHIIDLPKNKLGVDIEKGFEPQYTHIHGKEKVIQELQDAAREADQVLLATDPDREGEAISWHLCNLLELDGKLPLRVLINEFTSGVVKDAVSNPVPLDMDKVNSQQARRILDRLVGYQISPLLWDRLQKGLSAGRVQSVALKLICDRQKEIDAFKPEEYWSLDALLEKAGHPEQHLTASLKKRDGQEYEVKDQATMDAVVAEVSQQSFRVLSVDKSQKNQKPAPPFITSTLQQAASQLYNFPAKRTMRIAQELYEGIDLGDRGTQGLITYMRTDSTRVSEKAQEEVRQVITSRFGDKFLPDAPPVYKSGKGKVQDAHEAIRPADPTFTPDAAKAFLSAEQAKLYGLIWVRFAASQMRPAVYHQTRIDIEAGRYMFRATGRTEHFAGFLEVQRAFGVGAKKAANEDLPPLHAGDSLVLKEQKPEQHFTEPPASFTEASLVKTLEENGIGRPSTYATIISTLLDRKYVERDQKSLRPTELGKLVDELLEHNFTRIVDVGFTAGMEEQLDEVESGKFRWQDVLGRFYGDFKGMLETAQTKMRNVRKEVQATDIDCDKCGKKMVIRRGRYGRFLACPGFPKCKNTKQLDEEGQKPKPAEEPLLDEKCDTCGNPMRMRRGRFGMFKACSRYPECKFTRPVTLGIRCPTSGCDGELVARTSKRGKTFYGCTNYPACKFTSWTKPAGENCPKCSTFMVERRTKKGLEAVVCSSKECGFKRKVELEPAPAEVEEAASGELEMPEELD
ncbi:MAG: type I DNA topoisomerase [Candidatus Wallbacteria bacterium]|nr:type I DNA topoisomerase [Candidatus Wallbacteria bacterium]